MANLQDLKDQLREKQCEFENIKIDMDQERIRGGSLSSLYEAKNVCQGEMDSINKEIRRCENSVEPVRILFDKQAILSTSVIRRRDDSSKKKLQKDLDKFRQL